MTAFGTNDNIPSAKAGQDPITLHDVQATPEGLAIKAVVSWEAVGVFKPYMDMVVRLRNVVVEREHAVAQAETSRAKAENQSKARIKETNRIGRVAASRVRHLQDWEGLERREAIKCVCPEFDLAQNLMETLISQHNKRRDDRIERIRFCLLSKWRKQGLSNREMARRLNVTGTHVGRLLLSMKNKGAEKNYAK